MNEEIVIDYPTLKIMGQDALDFFIDEITAGNSISIEGCPEGKVIKVATKRDWSDALNELKINMPEAPKKVRI